MNTFILIMFMATGGHYQSGISSISQEFNTESACKTAGQSLAINAHNRHAYLMTWGCYPKGQAK